MNPRPVVSLALEPPLAVATLGRAPVNAIDEAWLADLEAALRALARAPRVAVLLLRSSQRAFCAGADLALMRRRFELALACDLRIAAEEAQLGLPEARLGLLPGAGGTQRLPRVAGEAAARRLILRGEAVGGREAAALGLVHWAVPGEALESRARALALELAAIPPATLAACKRCLAARGAEGYRAELAATGSLLAGAETQALVRRFLERKH